jgi:hypothetical protein
MCLSNLYYINMFLLCEVSVDFLTGLSSVQAFYIHHSVLVMCIIDLENNGRANCLELAEILNFGRIPQNFAVRKTCKTAQNEFSADKPVQYHVY